MNKRMETRVVSDSERVMGQHSASSDDSDSESDNSHSDSDADGSGTDEEQGPAQTNARSAPHTVTAKAVRAPSAERDAPRRTGRTAGVGSELVAHLTHTLNPAVQRARDEERSERFAASTQILAMSNQIRDLNTQLFAMQQRLSEAERTRDIAQLRLEFSTRPAPQVHHARSPLPPHQPIESPLDIPGWPRKGRRKHHQRIEQNYSDGGQATYWHTDGSETDTEYERQRIAKRRRIEGPSPSLRAHHQSRKHRHGVAHTPVSSSRHSGNGVEVSVAQSGRTPTISFLVSPSKGSAAGNSLE